MEQEKNENQGTLELDPSVIRERHSVQASLTDRYGVGVFTNTFRGEMEAAGLELSARRERIMGDIFTGSFTATGPGGGLESLLFMQEKGEAVSPDSQPGADTAWAWHGLMAIGSCLLFSMLMVKLNRKKKTEREIKIANVKL